MKLTLTHLYVKNSNPEFHENPTNGLVADTWHSQRDGRTDGRTDGRAEGPTEERTVERTWSPYTEFIFFNFVNVTHNREGIQLQ